MRYETLTLGGNVIRFPVELRAKPAIDLLIDVAPDSREVELIAEAFGFDAPDPEGRAKADRAMAERIAAMDLPVDREERRAALNAILEPLVDRAVAACAQARQASLRSDADNEKFAKAQMEGGYWLAPLRRLRIIGRSRRRDFRSSRMRPRRQPTARGGRSSSPSAARPGGPRTPRTT